jgi:GNAT superfamily N-acetyltransferase
MEQPIISPGEKSKVLEYFGKKPEDLTLDEFEQKHRELRTKYHPDKFEKYDDDIVKELTEERFKEIEQLAEKIRHAYFSGLVTDVSAAAEPALGDNPQFAFKNLKIEIITKEKDLKYHLFGTQYRWLEKGDKYVIKGTKASIIIDADYRGTGIGFNESIKMYLTFSETDSLEDIFFWLYQHIAAHATSVIIDREVVAVDYNEMLAAVKIKTVLRLN